MQRELTMARKKISLIGGGQIGGVLAQLIAQRQLGDVVLFDIVEDMPQGKTLDIAEAARIDGFDGKVEGTNDYKDIAGSDLVIITAGLPRKPGMSRDDLLTTNSKIMKSVAEAVRDNAPDAICIIISNPLDAMVTLFKKITNFPTIRVFGQAGIPIIRHSNVNGIPVMDLLERKYGDAAKAKEVMDAMVTRTKKAGGEVVGLLKTGSAFYSPAAAAVSMAEAIIYDEKRVLPVCAYLDGEFGVNGYYLGVPGVLGATGVEKVVEFSLDKIEQAALDNSINAVKNLVADMERLGF
jgi:malate dehydrogenase